MNIVLIWPWANIRLASQDEGSWLQTSSTTLLSSQVYKASRHQCLWLKKFYPQSLVHHSRDCTHKNRTFTQISVPCQWKYSSILKTGKQEKQNLETVDHFKPVFCQTSLFSFWLRRSGCDLLVFSNKNNYVGLVYTSSTAVVWSTHPLNTILFLYPLHTRLGITPRTHPNTHKLKGYVRCCVACNVIPEQLKTARVKLTLQRSHIQRTKHGHREVFHMGLPLGG